MGEDATKKFCGKQVSGHSQRQYDQNIGHGVKREVYKLIVRLTKDKNRYCASYLIGKDVFFQMYKKITKFYIRMA